MINYIGPVYILDNAGKFLDKATTDLFEVMYKTVGYWPTGQEWREVVSKRGGQWCRETTNDGYDRLIVRYGFWRMISIERPWADIRDLPVKGYIVGVTGFITPTLEESVNHFLSQLHRKVKEEIIKWYYFRPSLLSIEELEKLKQAFKLELSP